MSLQRFNRAVRSASLSSGSVISDVKIPMYALYSAGERRKADAAARKAVSLGGSWFHFNQGIYLKGQVLGSKGVCYALAAVFLARMKSGAGAYTSYVFSKPGREEVMDLWTTQKAGVSAWASYYLAGVNLKSRYDRTNDTTDGIKSLVSVPGYYIVGITSLELEGSKFEGHALAIINDGAKHYVFDANIGAGLFESADAAGTMFTAICKNMYPEFAKGATVLSRYS
jgi:hypothetical protein